MKFGFVSMLVRWFMIMGVLTAIYNPSGRSFVHWATLGTAPLSLRVAVGSVLLAMLAYFYRLTVRALGPIGLAILAAMLAVTATALVEIGLIQPHGRAAMIAYLQAIITTGLTIGVSWSALRTRISGQIDSDDVSRRWTP